MSRDSIPSQLSERTTHKFLVCLKWVVDETYIRSAASGQLDFSAADRKISDYDLNAIEEAVCLKALLGGAVVALTVGTPECKKGAKEALSRGADEAYLITDPSFGDLEPSQTAKILGEVIKSHFDSYDFIICGEGSSDLYAQQVGTRLAEFLDVPCICFVQKLIIDGARVSAERLVDDGVEVVEVTVPALVTVLPDINKPRVPGVKATLNASRKPITVIRREDLSDMPPARLHTFQMAPTKLERSCIRYGSEPEDIKQFIQTLRERGFSG